MRRVLRSGFFVVAISGIAQAGVVTNPGAVNLNWIEIVSEANAVLRSPIGHSAFSVRSTSTGLDLQLPENARDVSVSDLRGHIDSYRILSGERELKIASSRSGLLIVKVTTRDGTHTATVAPLR